MKSCWPQGRGQVGQCNTADVGNVYAAECRWCIQDRKSHWWQSDRRPPVPYTQPPCNINHKHFSDRHPPVPPTQPPCNIKCTHFSDRRPPVPYTQPPCNIKCKHCCCCYVHSSSWLTVIFVEVTPGSVLSTKKNVWGSLKHAMLLVFEQHQQNTITSHTGQVGWLVML